MNYDEIRDEIKGVLNEAVPQDDPTLLLVSGSKGSKEDDKQYAKKLGNAIIQVYTKHKSVNMRVVGAAANNNATKAFIIAKAEAVKTGLHLVMDPVFTNVNLNGEDRTGIVWHVTDIATLCSSCNQQSE